VRLLKTKINVPGQQELSQINLSVEVFRGNITSDDFNLIFKKVHQDAIHLYILFLDFIPSADELEIIRSNSQFIHISLEQRDIIKLLVVSLAKKRNEDINNEKLMILFNNIVQNSDIIQKIQEWSLRMRYDGYIIDFGAFQGTYEQTLRFFINSSDEFYELNDIFNDNIELRRMIPWEEKTDLSPDITTGVLERSSAVLEKYGFIEKKAKRFKITSHKTEKKILDIIENSGKTITINRLKNFFIFEGPTEEAFNSILSCLERKMILEIKDSNIINLISLEEVENIRKYELDRMRRKKSALDSLQFYQYDHIITWKKNDWHLISLNDIESNILELNRIIESANNEVTIRSHTYKIRELVKWYTNYVDVIISTNSVISSKFVQIELEINGLKNNINEIIEEIKRNTNPNLDVSLEEINDFELELNTIQEILSDLNSIDVLGSEFIHIFGPNKKPVTDILELVRPLLEPGKPGKGNWDIPEKIYLNYKLNLLQPQINEMDEIVQNIKTQVNSLSEIVNEIKQIIPEYNQNSLQSIYVEIIKNIINNRLSRPLMPLNINILKIHELDSLLLNSIENLKLFKNELNRIIQVYDELVAIDTEFNKKILIEEKICFITEFFFSNIPEHINVTKNVIMNDYENMCSVELEEIKEITTINDLKNSIIMNKNKIPLERMNLLLKDYYKLYNDLSSDIRIKLLFIPKFSDEVIPKLYNSDPEKISSILTLLKELYEDLINKCDDVIKYDDPKIEPPKFELNRYDYLDYEKKYRESLTLEIKELDEDESTLLLDLVDLLSKQNTSWIPIQIAISLLSSDSRDEKQVENIIMKISQKEIITLALTF